VWILQKIHRSVLNDEKLAKSSTSSKCKAQDDTELQRPAKKMYVEKKSVASGNSSRVFALIIRDSLAIFVNYVEITKRQDVYNPCSTSTTLFLDSYKDLSDIIATVLHCVHCSLCMFYCRHWFYVLYTITPFVTKTFLSQRSILTTMDTEREKRKEHYPDEHQSANKRHIHKEDRSDTEDSRDNPILKKMEYLSRRISRIL